MAGKYYESFETLLKPDPVYGDAYVAKFISCRRNAAESGALTSI